MPELSEYFGSRDVNTLRRLSRWCLDTAHVEVYGGFRTRFRALIKALFASVLASLMEAVAALDNTGPEPRSASDPRTVDWGD